MKAQPSRVFQCHYADSVGALTLLGISMHIHNFHFESSVLKRVVPLPVRLVTVVYWTRDTLVM